MQTSFQHDSDRRCPLDERIQRHECDHNGLPARRCRLRPIDGLIHKGIIRVLLCTFVSTLIACLLKYNTQGLLSDQKHCGLSLGTSIACLLKCFQFICCVFTVESAGVRPVSKWISGHECRPSTVYLSGSFGLMRWGGKRIEGGQFSSQGLPASSYT